MMVRVGATVAESIGIAGSGTIACALAVVVAQRSPVILWARSDGSARRALKSVARFAEKAGANVDGNVRVSTAAAELAGASFVVEAIVEEPDAKAKLFQRLDAELDERAILASTTSSLSVSRLAGLSGRPDRMLGLHVFNPVTKMDLVELVFPPGASDDTRRRARELCDALGKVAIEVPDTPGFVVNRLLFPFLFEAVRLHERTGLHAEAIDACLRLGAGHPMGPLGLLDLIGLDVAAAIGRAIGVTVPATVTALVSEGSLGRKTGRGFHDYEA
jgi:3-hydroxybutyryl-CoA dehydrogenase